MKTLSLLLLIAMGLMIPAQAQNATNPQVSEVRGIVSVVMDNSITIASDKLGEMAYAINAQTKILKQDGTAGTVASLTPGATVKIKIGSNPNQAGEIQIVAPKKEI